MDRKFSQKFHSEDCRFGYLPDGLGEMQFVIKDKEDKQEEIQRHKDTCDFSVMKSYLYQNAMAGNVQDYPVGVRDMDLSDEPNQVKVYVDYITNLFNSLPVDKRLGAKNPLEYIAILKDGGYAKILQDNKVDVKDLQSSEKDNTGGNE